MIDDGFESSLSAAEKTLVNSLDTPAKIQAFLDETPYSPEDANRCPLVVLHERLAHCLDGGLFGAAMLRRIGHPPLILDMLPDPGMDDDHVLALFQQKGCWGAVAKSNFSGLRYREPIYRSLRELVMSYFENFFNLHGQKTLRTYTRPINLAAYDRFGWAWRNEGADIIERRLCTLKRIPVLTPAAAAQLSPVDPLAYQAGMLGSNPDGLYQPGPAR
ncbi:MAG: hypothetical protein IT308_09780 [Anaerolineaceae bacterium]|nr:hypothetical protein [Anaerolineaceae bacterium]